MKLFKSPQTLLAIILIPPLLAFLGVAGLYLYLEPQLPSIEGLSDVRLQVPLRIYSSDGSLLGEFGEKRRSPKAFDQIPLLMREAFISAEDDRFYHHPGVDYQGIIRAAINLIKTGKRGQGGSTITMQLARNFYLSRKKTYLRKINEIFLALKIEHILTKDKILELYLNKIYLGNRAYGVAAAAQVYYGKPLDQLNLAQIAMIAGLPKAPSAYNPLANPERALVRRNYVLSRMHALHYITDQDYENTVDQPVTATHHNNLIAVQAPYVVEMVRAKIVSQFGDEAYTRGLKVYTTIKANLQKAANDSLWQGLVDYDRRHGYRGVIRHIELGDADQVDADQVKSLLAKEHDYSRFQPALVVATQEKDDTSGQPAYAEAMLKTGQKVRIDWSGMDWASPYIDASHTGPAPKTVADILHRGDVIWVLQDKKGNWMLGQIPKVQGALVSISPSDGAILALDGGFDYSLSKFNRAVQARRQPGSGFKPIIYSAALADGFTPASIINDAPVVFKDPALEAAWRPENYSGKFFGPTRLREALVHSINLVSIRLLRAVGITKAIAFARNFGFQENELPHNLSLALGSCEVSPLEMARAYSVIANGGYLIKPYYIKRIEDSDGTVLYDADPAVACPSCVLAQKQAAQPDADASGDTLGNLPKQAARTLDPRIAYQMNSIMKDVIRHGTGRRALQLGRDDLAGKTGTTNDQRDAWFSGFNQELVAVAWVGFDQIQPLGNRETGAHAALPIWMDYMRQALRGVPEKQMPRPNGLVNVKINDKTGQAATDTDTDTMFEVFRTENAPKLPKGASTSAPSPAGGGSSTAPEQLF